MPSPSAQQPSTSLSTFPPSGDEASTNTATVSGSEPPLTAIVAAELSPTPKLLTALDVSRNSIAVLPDGLCDTLCALRTLDISRNHLRVLPLGLPPTLVTLNLLSNNLRPIERSLTAAALSHLEALTHLDLRFNPKIKGSESTSAAISALLPSGAKCSVLLTEPRKPDAMPAAATRDATQVRCQLEPHSTPHLRKRLARTFGIVTDPDTSSREEVLSQLVRCYEERGPRPTTRVAGRHLGPIGRKALPELLEVLRATTFPVGERRERPRVRAEGYIILQRPLAGHGAEGPRATEARVGEEASRVIAARQDVGTWAPGAPICGVGVGESEQDEESTGTQAGTESCSQEAAAKARKAAAAKAAKAGFLASQGTTKARLALAKLKRHARIWELAEAIIAEADPAYAEVFTAVAVTKQFEGSPHIDTENVAPFYGLGVGEYEGGFICVESPDGLGVYEVDTQGRMGKVDGRYPHWVAPHKGERYSLIYYQTAGEWLPQAESVFAEEEPLEEQRPRVSHARADDSVQH
jgi:hypothetical protein